jgi:glucosamine--fructose-6-phosphate aminotransferase (isomerizing)
MCGIVGVISLNTKNLIEKNFSHLLQSLLKLEYRGYDSFGFSYIDSEGEIFSQKSTGKISQFVKDYDLKSQRSFSTGIAHTRWATHGGVSENNSHPHTGDFASLVHNGIIENYLELKNQLISEGYIFKSQTDTEVVVHLISSIIKKDLKIDNPSDIKKFSHEQKVQLIHQISKNLIKVLKGSYSLAIILKYCDGLILGIKNQCPLIVGKSSDSNFIASDSYAITNYTNQIATIEDKNYVILTAQEIKFFDSNSLNINIKFEHIEDQKEESSKGSFSSFMQKEIFEQSQTVRTNIENHLSQTNKINFKNVNFDLSEFSKISVIACGTSFYAGQLFCYYAESLAKIQSYCEIASEFRYRDIVFEPKTLYILISQSGETADTIAALEHINKNKHSSSKTMAVVNVFHSTIAKKSQGIVECFSGREIGVASTKNFTNQCISLLFIAMKIAEEKNISIDPEIFNSIKSLPSFFYDFLSSTSNLSHLQNMADKIAATNKVMFVARSTLYPIALEGALKLKELSYISTEGIAAGELKHGPIALIDEQIVCLCLVSRSILQQKTESSIHEILARNGKCLIITDYELNFSDKIENFLNINKSEVFLNIHKLIVPFLFIPSIQLLSFFVASKIGNDVDKPRNLAKSVTVE